MAERTVGTTSSQHTFSLPIAHGRVVDTIFTPISSQYEEIGVKVVFNVASCWKEAFSTAVYGYRMRNGRGKTSPYELLFGVPVHPGEDKIVGEWGYMEANDREIELLALEDQRTMLIDTPTNTMEAVVFGPGDEVLVVKGTEIGRMSMYPPFDSIFYGI